MLKTKHFDEFESLVLRKHENIQHFVKKTLTFKGGIPKLSDITQHMHLYVLLDREHREKSRPKPSVSVVGGIKNTTIF
jgi:hypothetical protein